MRAASPVATARPSEIARLLNRAGRRDSMVSWMMVAPLLAFIAVLLLYPICGLLIRSIYDPQVADGLPRTTQQLRQWDPASKAIPEAAYAALRDDLIAAQGRGDLGSLAGRLNQTYPGARSLLTKTTRRVARIDTGPYASAFVAIDPAWGDTALWGAIKNAGSRFTIDYFLQAFDFHREATGTIALNPPEQRITVKLFIRTFEVGLAIAFACTLLAYPLAFLIARLPDRKANILMMLVLLPFWTSILVKITSWIILLQQKGVINDLLVWSHVISESGRLNLMYNMTATLIVGTHIMLPFAILPIYSVMKSVPDNLMRAAVSLGGTRSQAFRRVYLPVTLPGVASGASFVFIMAVGYYITPALVGGQSGQLISNVIAYNMQVSLNWGLAAAISIIVLVVVATISIASTRLLAVKR